MLPKLAASRFHSQPPKTNSTTLGQVA